MLRPGPLDDRNIMRAFASRVGSGSKLVEIVEEAFLLLCRVLINILSSVRTRKVSRHLDACSGLMRTVNPSLSLFCKACYRNGRGGGG